MIISCEQCNKKFEVESSLIPSTGRLLQCSSCDFKWFYKKNISSTQTDKILKTPEKKEAQIKKIESNIIKSNSNEAKVPSIKDKKVGILSIIIVFLITFASLIILLDTFKEPISNYFPNTNLILNSLYESIKDLSLFIQNLFQ